MKKESAPTAWLWGKIKQIDLFLDFHYPLLLLLLLGLVLRLPNITEPYWYGDEGIYLTIGTALNHGRMLYSEIIDHKTPLIYLLAMVQQQLYFRLLLIGWMLASTACFYALAYQLFKRRLSTALATLFFVLSTTLPWFEGNIPNGELFVMGFILLGAVVLIKTNFFKRTITGTLPLQGKSAHGTLFASGVIFGLAILTKVPALFDVAAFFVLGVIPLVRGLSFLPTKIKKTTTLLKQISGEMFNIVAGVLTALGGSILYFAVVGSLDAYLEYGLLYNFRYAGSWALPFESPLLVFAFSLLGKFLLAALLILAILGLRQWIKAREQFSLCWLVLALFASLLSNRPYPHYFLQLMPPLALLFGSIVQMVLTRKQTPLRSLAPVIGSMLVVLGVTTGALTLLKVGRYPVVSYYQNWLGLLQGSLSPAEYRSRFNYLMADNYRAAEILKTAENNTIFIWGTNPVLYALSETIPTGRFTVSFHIKDFDAYDETLASIVAQEPEYVVVMNDERDSFPALNQLLVQHYHENSSFDHFSIWRRTSL